MAGQKNVATIDGHNFSSEPEVKTYELLKKYFPNSLVPHPKPVTIIEGFTSKSGKKNVPLKYEPDFLINGRERKIWLEVKGNNDLVMLFLKGRKPATVDKGELYRLRHRIFDKYFTELGDLFLVVRVSNLKTPAYAGIFGEADWAQVKKYKTQERPDLALQVPRLDVRLHMMLTEQITLFEDEEDKKWN